MDHTMDTLHADCADAIELKGKLEYYYLHELSQYHDLNMMREFRNFFHLQHLDDRTHYIFKP